MYEKNLKSLLLQNPLLSASLYAVEGNARFDVFQDPKDPLNVNIFDTQSNQIMYASVPQQEILERVDLFEAQFNRYPILFIFGIANGLFIKLLLQNTNHLRIYVIEPEIELLYIALNLLDFSSDLESGRLQCLMESQIDFPQAVKIFNDPAIKVFCKTYHLEPNGFYYEHFFSTQMLRCNEMLIRAIQHVIVGLGNDSTDSLIGLEWHLANVEKMVETPTLLELVRHAKTTDTAIIVSTGPSLAKQLPLLKEIMNHATLFSVDASFPILERHGIKPDIVFSIERVAETAEFYKRTSPEFQQGVICAMSSLAHPALIDSVTTGILQLSMRPFGYTRYFDLPEYGYVGIGMSAANMAYEVAFHSKFKTIILIGQDLAYGKSGQSHSEGHVLGSLKGRKDDFEIEAYGGEGTVMTSKIWNMFRNFFENDIHYASLEGIETINATEGGARIHGALELSFQEAIDRYIDRTHLKQPIHLAYPTPSEVIENRYKVEDKLVFMEQYVASMQSTVASLFEKVATVIQKLDKSKARTNLDQVDYDELASLMGEIDEIKAKFEEKEFVDIFIDATQALIIHHELEIARIQVRPIQNDDERRLKMIDWIYAHQHWLFALAGIMEAELIAIRRRGNQSRYVHKAELSEDGMSINGHFYDYKNEIQDFEIELVMDGEAIFATTLIGKGSKSPFSFSIPSRFFNDQVHWISVREKSTGIILMGMPENRLLLSADKNKAQFMESLNSVDLGQIKDMYCANSIGFLAIEENLKDKEFVQYLKELLCLIPQAILKVFCLNASDEALSKTIFYDYLDRVSMIELNSINNIVLETGFYLATHNSLLDHQLDIALRTFTNIPTIHYDLTPRKLTIKSVIDLHITENHPIFRFPESFGYTHNDVSKNGYSIYRILYKNFLGFIDDNENLYDFLYRKLVPNLIINNEFRIFYVGYIKLEAKILNEKY